MAGHEDPHRGRRQQLKIRSERTWTSSRAGRPNSRAVSQIPDPRLDRKRSRAESRATVNASMRGRWRCSVDRISTPQGPSKPTSRMARMKPTTSWAPDRRACGGPGCLRITSRQLSTVGVAEFHTEHHVGVETLHEFGSVVSARKTCQKSTTNPADGWPAARISSAPWGIDR